VLPLASPRRSSAFTPHRRHVESATLDRASTTNGRVHPPVADSRAPGAVASHRAPTREPLPAAGSAAVGASPELSAPPRTGTGRTRTGKPPSTAPTNTAESHGSQCCVCPSRALSAWRKPLLRLPLPGRDPFSVRPVRRHAPHRPRTRRGGLCAGDQPRGQQIVGSRFVRHGGYPSLKRRVVGGNGGLTDRSAHSAAARGPPA
jgi:hypothetical protein